MITQPTRRDLFRYGGGALLAARLLAQQPKLAKPWMPGGAPSAGTPPTPFALIAHAAAGCVSGDIIAGPTGAIDTTGAKHIVIFASFFGDKGAQLPSDSKGNTYTPLTPLDGTGANSACIFVCLNTPTVGAGHTFTWNTGASVFPSIYAAAFSGPTGVSVDQQSNAQAMQPGSITPTVNGALVIAGFGTGGAGVTPTVDVSFTLTDALAFLASGDNDGGGLAYQIQTTAAPANPTWATNPNPRSVIASFKF